MKNSLIAIIPAAGIGTRACKNSAHELPKQYRNIAGKPMLIHSIMALLSDSRISNVIVSVSPKDTLAENILSGISPQVIVRKYGGSTRFETVRNTINNIEIFDNDWIIIHDAARPGLPISCLKLLIDNCLSSNAVGGLLAIPVSNTIKKGSENIVNSTIERDNLWLAQTPQMFRASYLRRALNMVSDRGLFTTDESSALEFIGFCPIIIRGSIYNMKVTWPEDFDIMEKLI